MNRTAFPRLLALLPAVLSLGTGTVGGQTSQDYLDKILERRPFTPAEAAVLNRDAHPEIDVRDLVIYLSGQDVSASFASAETLAFHPAGLTTLPTVTLPIYFSKPVTGTIKLDLGGTASEGAEADFTILYHQAAQKTFTVVNATSLDIPIQLRPWQGIGGEKVIRLTINRNPEILPENGTYSTHLLRIRQFDAGEFVGMLSFPPGSGLPSLPVRIGLGLDGSAMCSFQQASTLLGSSLNFSWNTGYQGFPNFPEPVPITIPGENLNRTNAVNATLSIQRLSPPFHEELVAFLEGFPENDQPALYHATFTFHDLIGAGARFSPGPNPYAVVHQGRLTLQPVSYAE